MNFEGARTFHRNNITLHVLPDGQVRYECGPQNFTTLRAVPADWVNEVHDLIAAFELNISKDCPLAHSPWVTDLANVKDLPK